MRGTPNLQAPQLHATHAPAAATAAVITIAAEAEVVHVLDQIEWSYDAAPTGGRLTVTIGGTTVLDLSITADGPGFIPFPKGLYGTVNQAVVITLASGGGTVVGKINATYR